MKIPKIKHFLKSIISSVLILMSCSIVNAQDITDLNQSADYSLESIQNLSKLGIISGDEQGRFNPKKAVTRAEMITMIVKALNIDTTNIQNEVVFKDVPKDDWSFKYVQAAYEEGIINGITEDVFGKNQKCTREQMAVIFIRALNMSKDSTTFNTINSLYDVNNISSWAKNEVDLSIEVGLMKGIDSNKFDPKGEAKREQVAVVMDRFIKNKESLTKKYVNYYRYPEFYDIMEKANSNPYKGKVSSMAQISLQVKDIDDSTGYLYNNIKIEHLVNDRDMKSDISFTTQTDLDLPGEFTENKNSEMIKVGNSIYIKENNAWLKEELSPDEDWPFKVVEDGLFYNFNRYIIQCKKDINLNGVNTTQYTMKVSMDDLINTLSSSEYHYLKEAVETTGIDDMNFTVDYFINDQNQIIQTKIKMDSIRIKKDDLDMRVDYSITSDYKNIGEEIKIDPPVDFNK